jgi:hypothetical protein
MHELFNIGVDYFKEIKLIKTGSNLILEMHTVEHPLV